jgi:hypothetical protein
VLQLLWIETLLKLACGGLLLFLPNATARILGLTRAETPFWPQLLGGVLIGLAAATFLEGFVRNAHGLGLAGAIAINFTIAATLATLLAVGKAAPARRGRALLWLAVILLVLLAFSELAVV